MINCKKCVTGYYKIKEGKYGYFVGCSNYSKFKCNSTLSIPEYALSIFNHEGIKLYSWERECWNCHKTTSVLTYFLDHDLINYDSEFNGMVYNTGLGDIPRLDNYLLENYDIIKRKYSRTVNETYIANTCMYCNSIQGRFYVVDDPHEIFLDWTNYNLDKYVFDIIKPTDFSLTLSDFEGLFCTDDDY